MMKKSAHVTVRRAPKYGAFALVGALVGLVISGIFAVLPIDMSEQSQDYSRGAVVGMGVVLLTVAGAVLGAGVAVVVDAVMRRKARTVEVVGHYEQQGQQESAQPSAADQPEGASSEEAEEQAEEEEEATSSLEVSPEERREQTEDEHRRARAEGEA